MNSLATIAGGLAAGLDPHAGNNVQDLVLPWVGAALVILLAIRALAALADEKPGRMVGLVLAAVIPAGFIFAPQQGVAVLTGLWSLITGGGA